MQHFPKGKCFLLFIVSNYRYNSLYEAASGCLPLPGQLEHPKRRNVMGEKGSKKDKNKAEKQKQSETEKKKEQQKSKLPAKKP
jgi:hypothetical protein